MRNNISAKIKTILKANGVENKVSTYGKTITVKCLSEISASVRDQIKALETVEAHGDSMDDTRYYTGLSIQFNFSWELTEADKKAAQDALASWSDRSKEDRISFTYHIKKQLSEEYGPKGELMSNFLGYY